MPSNEEVQNIVMTSKNTLLMICSKIYTEHPQLHLLDQILTKILRDSPTIRGKMSILPAESVGVTVSYYNAFKHEYMRGAMGFEIHVARELL